MSSQNFWKSYEEFWVNFASNLTDKEKLLFSTIPQNGWYESRLIPSERNTKYCFQVSKQKRQMAVFIIIEAEDELINKDIFDKIFRYKSVIELELGFFLTWEREKTKGKNSRISCRIHCTYQGIDCLNKANFDLVTNFLIERMRRLVQVFDKYFLIIKLPSPTPEMLRDRAQKLDHEVAHLPSYERRFKLQEIRGKMQVDFRAILLKIYGCACAVCGLSVEAALEAAHIVQYSEANDEQRVDPQNGILLCAVHHKFFDRGIIKISEGYRLHCQTSLAKTEYDKLMLIPFHQKILNLPKENKYLPNKEYLESHWTR